MRPTNEEIDRTLTTREKSMIPAVTMEMHRLCA